MFADVLFVLYFFRKSFIGGYCFMSVLDYFSEGFLVFKGNSFFWVCAVILIFLQLLVCQGFFNGFLFHVTMFSPLILLSMVLGLVLFCVSVFVNIAVMGMSNNMLLKEDVNLKKGWMIGKKFFLKVLGLQITLGAIIILSALVLGIILAGFAVLFCYSSLSYGFITMGFMVLIGLCAVLMSVLSLFALQFMVIGQKGIAEAIKENPSLVLNNKTMAIILLIPLLLNMSITAMPVVGSVLSNVIGPVIGIYLLIVVTLAYTDLTQPTHWKTW
ncbi:MAG: hypothetical protein NKF70_00950 [Methanobacterium sp. ERen5]|nr:MAG: hypothetical protein NKF70_00950 [Methanobacterium sp. ERen5]